MHLWFLSKPGATSGLLAGQQARHDAIARASLLSMTVTKQIVVTTVRAMVAWSRALLRAIARESERRRAVATLRALDDRMLRDMGIARSEIMGVVEDRQQHRPASLAELRGLPRPGSSAAAQASRSDDLPDEAVSITQRAGRWALPQPVPAVAATVSAPSPLRRYIGQARTGWL